MKIVNIILLLKNKNRGQVRRDSESKVKLEFCQKIFIHYLKMFYIYTEAPSRKVKCYIILPGEIDIEDEKPYSGPTRRKKYIYSVKERRK